MRVQLNLTPRYEKTKPRANSILPLGCAKRGLLLLRQ